MCGSPKIISRWGYAPANYIFTDLRNRPKSRSMSCLSPHLFIAALIELVTLP